MVAESLIANADGGGYRRRPRWFGRRSRWLPGGHCCGGSFSWGESAGLERFGSIRSANKVVESEGRGFAMPRGRLLWKYC
jgi:hypothetical protein